MRQNSRHGAAGGRAPVWTGVVLVALGCVVAACGATTTARKPSASPTKAATATPTPPPKGWSAAITPKVGDEGRLVGVAARSASDAWAVGQFQGTDAVQHTLAEHWDGKLWTAVSSPNPGTRANLLSAVAVVGPTEAWAVGEQDSGTTTFGQPLIERWDGAGWSVVPSSFTGDGGSLMGVSGTAANDVWAVGTLWKVRGPQQGYDQTSLIEHWDGSAWSVVSGATLPASPNGTNQYQSLAAVAALAPNDVWAVGSVVEHWDGHQWTIVPLPSATGVYVSGLTGISAISARDVWAVGTGPYAPRAGCAGVAGAIIYHWDGSRWSSVAPAQNASGSTSSYSLASVAAVAANDVWAVGGRTSYVTSASGADSPVIEHWDGSAWSMVQVPAIPTREGLTDIAASQGGIWSVGQLELTDGVGPTLIERWDGHQWAEDPSPSPGTLSNELHGVAAISASDVWAVGSSAAGTLAEHWDGHSWITSPALNASQVDNTLNGVSATGPSDVWAVGSAGSVGQDGPRTLIEHWNGSQWSLVPGDPSAQRANLAGVAARTPTDAWAVGSAQGMALVEHWDGASWTAVKTATFPANSAYNYGGIEFTGVAALAANDVWIVGGSPPHSCGGPIPVLIEHWDGTQWTIVPNLPQGMLYGITAISANDIWAVGGSLALHWDGKQWSSIDLPKDPTTSYAQLKAVAGHAASDMWAVGEAYATSSGAPSLSIYHWDGSQWSAQRVGGPGQEQNQLEGLAVLPSGAAWAVGYFSATFDFVNGRQALIERYVP